MVDMARQVGVGRVHHEGGLDAVEGAAPGHDDLAAAALLGGRAEHGQAAARRVGDGRRRQRRAQPGGGDHVVTAGVADVGQGVVLAQDGDDRPVAGRRRGPGRRSGPRRRPARCRGPLSSRIDVRRSWAWCSSKPSSGSAWMRCEASSSRSARRSTSSHTCCFSASRSTMEGRYRRRVRRRGRRASAVKRTQPSPRRARPAG